MKVRYISLHHWRLHLRTLALAWLTGLWGATGLAATEPDTRAWITDGTVHAITRFGPTVYLGGDFSYIGPNTGLGASLDARNGQAETKFARVDGGNAVYAAVSDGAGGWFIGGNFTRVGTAVRNNLAHVKNDGSVDELFSPDPNRTVRALAYDSDAQRLYVGGNFTEIGGSTRRYLAAINTQSGALTGWNPTLSGVDGDHGVHALALSADGRRLYAGGDFDAVSADAAAARFVALDTFDGSIPDDWASANHTVGNGMVKALAVDDNTDTVFLGGTFTTLGGVGRNHLGAVSATTGALQAWNPNATGGVNAFALDANEQQIYVGGDFTEVGGIGRARLARVDTADATVDGTWAPNPEDTVHTLALADRAEANTGDLFVGGDFERIAGAAQRVQARISSDGELVATWKPLSRGVVRAMAVSNTGTALYVGGLMTSNGGQARKKLASVLAVNGTPTTWAPQVEDGSVRALAVTVEGSRIYVAGDFTGIGDIARNGIARLGTDSSDPTAWVPDGWQPDLGAGMVHSLALAALGANVWAVAIHPSNTDIIYAGTEKGLYKTLDGGLSWNRLSLGGNVEDVRALLIDPRAPSTVYAGTFGSGVLKTTDAGETWTAMNEGLTHLQILSLAMLPDGSMLFAGNAGATGVDTGLFTLTEGEDTWQVLLTGEMRSIAVDRRDDNYVYIAAPDGVWRWNRKDGRTAFSQLIRGLAERSVRTIVSTSESFLCAGEEYTKLYVTSGAIVYRLSCEVVTDTATGRPVLDENDQEVQAATWVSQRAGLPTGTITGLVLHPQNNSLLYASTLSKGIFKWNAGPDAPADERVWKPVNNGLGLTTLYSLAMAPGNSDMLFAGAALGFAYRSDDAAANWRPRNAGIPTDILYAGGSFQGAERRYLASLATGVNAADYFGSWDAAADGPVNALQISKDGNNLFVGGAFSQIGGAARNRVAILLTADASANGFTPSVDDGEVRALDVDDAERRIYLGGTFTSVNSRTRERIAAVTIADGSLTEWNPGSDGEVNALLVTNHDNLVVAAGTFSNIGGQAHRYLATLRTDKDTNSATDWDPDPDAPFPSVAGGDPTFPIGQALAVDSRDDALDVFVGGGFTKSSALRTRSFAAYRFTPPRVKVDPPAQAYNTPQRISLTCVKTVEEPGEEGVTRRDVEDDECQNNIFYTTDSDLANADWQQYTAPIDFDETIELSYYAVFNEGMRNATVTRRYIFDTTKPRITANIPGGTYSSTRVVNLTCEDGAATDPAVSQCAAIYYTVDGQTPTFEVTTDEALLNTTRPLGSTRRYANFVPIIVDAELKFIAVDSAGNASPVNAETYRIERGEGSGALSLGVLAMLAGLGACVRRRARHAR